MHSRQFRRTPTIRILRTNRKTHTSDTRESLRLDGIISAFLFPFHVLLKLSLFRPRKQGISRLIRIRFIHDRGFEWNVLFLPTNATTWEIGCVMHARVRRFIRIREKSREPSKVFIARLRSSKEVTEKASDNVITSEFN